MTTVPLVPVGTPPAPKPDRPPFAIVPLRLLGDVRLSAHDKLVFAALSGRANDRGICWPSQGTIGADVHVSRASVQRALDTLEETGWLRSLGMHHAYRVTVYQVLYDVRDTAMPAELERATDFADPAGVDPPEQGGASHRGTGGLSQRPGVPLTDAATASHRGTELDSRTNPPPSTGGAIADADDDERPSDVATPVELPPWHVGAPADVRATFADLSTRAGPPTAVRRMLRLVRADGLPWSAIGAALIELAPRGTCPTSNDVRVYATEIVRRRTRIPGARIRQDLRAPARPIGPSFAESMEIINAAAGVRG